MAPPKKVYNTYNDLSPLARKVSFLLGCGMTYEQAGYSLYITVGTVRSYIQRTRHLGFSTKELYLAKAIERGELTWP